MDSRDVIKESIEILEKDIKEKLQQIACLKEFESVSQNGITEDQYHECCETNMRYTDVLGKSLLISLPFLEYSKRGCNHFFYTYKGYTVRIPNSRVYGIELVFPNKYYKEKPQEKKDYFLQEIESKIANVEKYLRSKSIKEKSKILFPQYRTWLAIICFLIKHKASSKKLKQGLLELQKQEEEMTIKNHEKWLKALSEYKTQKALIDEFSSLALEWTETVRVYEEGWESYVRKITKG